MGHGMISIAASIRTYQLLIQGNLVELQLVDLGGGTAQEGSRQQRSQLHDGRQMEQSES